ncbi:hypothetical protein LJC74_05380 [Eubacteriales bacterium OttesenSCG-928-A19]|nr:hypothetical protein [Eubacteriales bacterium OttesenSCG-928-A19]
MLAVDAFIPVRECDIPCRDAWPLEGVRYSAMLAYRRLDRGGDIRLLYPVLVYSDCVVIQYNASLPHEWIIEQLRKAEDALIVEATKEREWLEARIIELDAVMNESLLPVFEKTAARYRQVQKILM